MNLMFCTNCNYKLDGEVCKNCFMAVDPDRVDAIFAGTEFCRHRNAHRTPTHDEDGTWYCFDCNTIY